jgi:hypothetical protein
VPKYSAPVAVADVLVVFGMATMNRAAVGNGIGNVAVRDEQYPHCVLKPYCAIGQITTSRNRNTYRSCCNLSYAYGFTVTVGIITCVVEILAYDNIFI